MDSQPSIHVRDAVRSDAPRSRTSDIYDRIRDDIIHGQFTPGSKLKIDLLRAHYEVGATPLREALSLLTAQGLVERLDQRGFRVPNLVGSEFVELLAMRCWLEERALRQAIQKGGKQWEEGIVVANYRLSRTPRVSPDISPAANLEYERCHKAFHLSLVAGCCSSMLLRFWHQIYNEASRYRYITRMSAHERPELNQEHAQIADAVLARNADLAVQLITAHYTKTWEMIKLTIPATVKPHHEAMASSEPALADGGASSAK
jgi:DNA-binding GntR family transcriptional regulator